MIKKIAVILLIVLIAINLLPYLIPVTKPAQDTITPFAESFFKEVEGVLLHCRVWEPADEQYQGNVLLVHGLGGSTFSWRKNIDALVSAGYFVVAVDLPGFGYSDRKRGINHSQESRSQLIWQLIDHVEDTFDIVNNDEKWSFVGHSMGGGTITAMVIERPKNTHTIIYVAGAVLSGGNRMGTISKYPPVGRWIEVIGRRMFFTENRINNFLSSAYGFNPSQNAIEGYLAPLLLPGTEGAFVDMIRTSSKIKQKKLADIEAPVYAIWGEMDTWVSVEDAHRLKGILSDMTLKVIPQSYHCPMETHQEIFNQYLLDALKAKIQ